MSADISLATLATMPAGTCFWHEYFDYDDESEECVLVSAEPGGEEQDGEGWLVRYVDLAGVERTMWISDDDSGIFLLDDPAATTRGHDIPSETTGADAVTAQTVRACNTTEPSPRAARAEA